MAGDPSTAFLAARRIIKDTAPRFFRQPTVELETALRKARFDLATAILEFETLALVDMFESPRFDCHDLLRRCHLQYTPLESAERRLVDGLLPMCRADWDDPATARSVVVLMLFRQAYQFAADLDVVRVPAWLRPLYVRYLVAAPSLFAEPGEIDRYVDHIERVLTALRDRLSHAADQPVWRRVLADAVDHMNLVPVLFTDRNVRAIFENSAWLTERLLTLDGAALDLPAEWIGQADSRTRIGFLVRDGSPRTESYVTLAHVQDINSSRYHVFLYALDWNQGPFQDTLRESVEQFTDLSNQTVGQSVERIRDDRLDFILLANVGFGSVSRFNKIAAHRLARVQLASTAYHPATTGFRRVDHMLSVRRTEPEDDPQAHFTERLILSEGDFACYAYGPPRPEPAVAAPKLLSRIPEDAVVFTVGATFFKLIPELTRVWMEILAAVPNGYLVMFFQNPNWAQRYPTYFLVRRLVRECQEYGADASRLVIMPPLSRGDIHAIMARTDIYLDSHPYAGASSLMDPLPAGVPVVAWRGHTQRAIQGAAMLRGLGLDDWVAGSAEEYRGKALALARDRDLRDRVRSRIRERMASGPFLDAKGYARRLMGILEQLDPGHRR